MSRPDETAAGARWPRRDRLALLALVVGMLASLPFLVHPWFDPMPDASMYLITARSLLAGDGYSMLGEPFHVRPPGLPAVFVPVLAVFGNDFHVLNLTIALFGVLLVALLFVLWRPALGGPLALLVGACLWLNPAFRLYSNQLLSDVPGAALVVLVLVLEVRARRRPGLGGEVLLGLALAAATYVRTLAILLVPAIWLGRLLARRRGELPDERAGAFAARRLLLFAGVAALLLLPWQVRQASLDLSAPAEQTFVHDYATGMFREDVGDPTSRRLSLGEILERSVRRRFGQIAGTAGNRLLSLEAGPFALVLAAVLLAGLVRRLAREPEPRDLFVLGSLAVLSVYFGYQERLFLPVYVLLLPAGVQLLRLLAGRWLPATGADGVVGALLLALLLVDLDPRRDWGAIKKRHNDFVELAAELNEALPPEVVLATGKGFEHQVYLRRPVYSLSFVERRGGQEAVLDLIERKNVGAVVLWRRFREDRELSGWLPRHFPRTTEVGPAVVVHVK